MDEWTGYVIDLKKLRDVVQEHLIEKLDHRNLNIDVEFMRGINPTAENIVIACWRVLEPAVNLGRLVRLRLCETDTSYVDCEGVLTTCRIPEDPSRRGSRPAYGRGT